MYTRLLPVLPARAGILAQSERRRRKKFNSRRPVSNSRRKGESGQGIFALVALSPVERFQLGGLVSATLSERF